ncbi:MAG: FkbM family methyltransferase [Lachnospiraceae bacterium]|nr:FkbM family methyltransferase [Lachnospiraceae bacterium]
MKKSRLKDELEWVDGTSTFENDLLEKVKTYNEVIIFGAGIGGRMTCDLLEEHGQSEKIKAFSDNNKDKIGSFYLGKPVIAPGNITNNEKQLVLVCSTAFDIIFEQLVNMGIGPSNIYFFQPAGISLSGSQDILFIKENMDRFEAIYDKLADEKSRKIYRSLLNYRISKRVFYLEDIKDSVDREENQYFDEEILNQYFFSEGFVDAGAYIGDTISAFFHHYPDFKGNYYCMEAGTVVYGRLCENISKMNYKNVYPYQYAVWDEEGTLKFDTTTFGDGGGSRVSDNGEIVDCDCLDHLLEGKSVDFIKMDIEGAEKKALSGAKELIRKNRPILTICIYHKQEDFFDIPETIEDILEDEYIFYVRQYRYGQSETVLYAMPKSRKMK